MSTTKLSGAGGCLLGSGVRHAEGSRSGIVVNTVGGIRPRLSGTVIRDGPGTLRRGRESDARGRGSRGYDAAMIPSGAPLAGDNRGVLQREGQRDCRARS